MDVHWLKVNNIVITLSMLIGMASLPSLVLADANLWQDISSDSLNTSLYRNSIDITHQKSRSLNLENQTMNSLLDSSDKIPLALSDGSTLTVRVEPSSIVSKRLSKQFNIKTYRVLPDTKVISGRVGISPSGFHAMIQMRSGETFFIDPQSVSGANPQHNRYVSYRKQDQYQDHTNAYSCGVSTASDTLVRSARDFDDQSTNNSSKSLTTYKIAIAATGEYVEKKGGTVSGALAAIVTTLSRVNQVYEQDLGIHLQLVENNDLLIYTDAASDPYSSTDLEELNSQNQENINATIGVANYDIGHLFTTKGGGYAAIGGVCSEDRKARGVSGVSNPVNDSFNLDFVAHEIGHQLGATHTFNGIEGLCSSNTRTSTTAFEPGSGSTIMSYAGYCGVDNLQSHSDAMFHIGSINQIRDFTTNDRGNRCGSRNETQNSAPTVNAGKDYIIPAQTPFELSGTADDSDGDQLVFAWEQIDSGEQSQYNNDTGDNALFRVHFPSNLRTRSFPPIQNILSHSTVRGETLPIQQRSLNFSFVAQDGFNAAESDEMSITVLRTGSRFALNMPRTSYTRGATHKLLWNTANTEKAPINCDAVDIYISHDGGKTFKQELATAVPNIGEVLVTIPADFPVTSVGRFKLSCSNNVFFAVSYRNFIVNRQGDIIAATFSDEDQLEPDISDRVIGSTNSSNATSFTQSEQTQTQGSEQGSRSSGGSFDFLFLYFTLLVFSLRRNFVGTIV